MPSHEWPELLGSGENGPSLVVRVLLVIGLFLLVAAVGVGVVVIVDMKNDLARIDQDNNARLSPVYIEHSRTQTLVCLAHPEIHDRAFTSTCADVMQRWKVTETTSTSTP